MPRCYRASQEREFNSKCSDKDVKLMTVSAVRAESSGDERVKNCTWWCKWCRLHVGKKCHRALFSAFLKTFTRLYKFSVFKKAPCVCLWWIRITSIKTDLHTSQKRLPSKAGEICKQKSDVFKTFLDIERKLILYSIVFEYEAITFIIPFLNSGDWYTNRHRANRKFNSLQMYQITAKSDYRLNREKMLFNTERASQLVFIL